MIDKEFKEKAEKAHKIMDSLKVFLKDFDRFKKENKDDEKMVMAVDMAIISVLLDNLTENPLTTIGIIESIKSRILSEPNMIEELDAGTKNYIG